MARIDDIFKKEIRHADTQKKRKGKFRWVHYTKLYKNKDQYCDPTPDEIERLADLIDAEGEVLQDLVIKKAGPDEYEIVAGHKRHLACKMLVEERGKKEYEFLPCYEINDSEVRSEFRVYATNGYHEKTDYEKMHEIERMRALLTEYPEEFPNVQGGRMVERLAQIMDIKKTTVGEYLTISRNLSEKGMELFKTGQLKKSAAVALAGIPGTEQDKLLDQGIITHKQIKESREARKPEPPSAYGTQKRVHPEDSLIRTPGCEGGHDCFLCAQDCEIRGEDRHCRKAPLGNPFPCDTMNNISVIRKTVGNKCQFINQDLAKVYPGSGERNPCCMECETPCEMECSRALGERTEKTFGSVVTSQQHKEDAEYIPGKCMHNPEFLCSLSEEAMQTPGTGEGNCGEACCWECRKEGCKLRCRASETRMPAMVLQKEKSEMSRQETLIDKAERVAEAESGLSDLEFARQELEVAQSILWEMTGRGVAFDEKCIRSQKLLVAAYKSLIRSLEQGIQLSQIK